MLLRISPAVLEKVPRRGIEVTEIKQCFANRDGGLCEDTRVEHLTDPVTRWFVAQTDRGRELKIMYVPLADGIELKSAYDATPEIIRIYNKYAK